VNIGKGKIISKSSVITRFAPSPSGYLHLGHAYSAWFSERAATELGGEFILRIEDIDQTRCRREYEEAILEDLDWLGLSWGLLVRRQSDHMADYAVALESLKNMGLIYPCFCTRKEIRVEIKNINAAPHVSAKDKRGPIYPGTCRAISSYDRELKIAAGDPFALRLNMEKAILFAEAKRTNLWWMDMQAGKQHAVPEIFGDVVLARKDEPTSYHLSVVVDDAFQGVTLVTRGEDLRDVTHIHCLLQVLLDFDVPQYSFHHLLIDKFGKRLAKRDHSVSLRSLREVGTTLEYIKKMTGIV